MSLPGLGFKYSTNQLFWLKVFGNTRKNLALAVGARINHVLSVPVEVGGLLAKLGEAGLDVVHGEGVHRRQSDHRRCAGGKGLGVRRKHRVNRGDVAREMRIGEALVLLRDELTRCVQIERRRLGARGRWSAAPAREETSQHKPAEASETSHRHHPNVIVG